MTYKSSTKKGFTEGYKTYDTSHGFGNKHKWRKAFYQRMTGKEAEHIISSQADTPCAILGVAENATEAEIKTAFRKLINFWHPDKNPDNLEKATEMSKRIIAAYTILTK